MNAFDVAILGAFVGIITLGFFSGITRVTAAIFGIYFSSVGAAAFYRPVARGLADTVPSMGTKTGNLFIFVVLFMVFTAATTYLFSKWLGDLRLPRRLEILDNVGGAALGIAVSALAVTLAAMLLVVLLQALNQTFGGSVQESMVGTINGQMRGSELVAVILRAAPYLERTISPWFPNGLPPILSGAMEA